MNIWTFWDKEAIRPPYIDLCFETMKKYCPNLVILDDESVLEHLPDLDPRLEQITYDQTGTFIPSQRADFIKVKLLNRYGGLFLDADTIVVQSLVPVFDRLAKHSFVGRLNEIGTIAVNFMACRPGDSLMAAYSFEMDKMIEESLVIKKENHPGTRLLTRLKDRMQLKPFLYTHEVSPINFKHWKNYFNEAYQVGHFVFKETLCFQLWNRVFPESFKQMSAKDVLRQDWLISKLFNYALKEG